MKPHREVRGSSVVVIGATSGAGRATALSLAASGARLVLAARSAPALEQVTRECIALGGEALAVPTDIRCSEELETLRDRAVCAFGTIDTWINTASVLVVGAIDQQPIEDISALIATNVLGIALASRVAVAQFRAQGHGVLINTSSLLGMMPNPVVPTYAMTKFAVRGLSMSLHSDFPGRHSPIRICTILPGPIDSPMFRHAANHSGRAIRAIPPAASPDRVAAAIIRSVRRPRRQRTVGVVGVLIILGEHIAPRLTEATVAATAARLIFRPMNAAATSGSLHTPPSTGATTGRWRRGKIRTRWGDRIGRRLSRS